MLKIPSIIHLIPFLESINKAALPPNEPKGSSGDISTALTYYFCFTLCEPHPRRVYRTPDGNYNPLKHLIFL